MDYGSLVISLDFELIWGMLGKSNCDNYAETNVKHVRNVIPRLIQLFEKYDVNATFATVGFLFLNNREEFASNIPKLTPNYTNNVLSPYTIDWKSDSIAHDWKYFCPEIITELKNSNHIEIATHTYCHYYCWEDGQNIEQFEVDIEKAIEVAEKNNTTIKSIVFPRNQVNEAYLGVCARHGIRCFRGNAERFYGHSSDKLHALTNKIGRILDTYITLFNPRTIKYDNINIKKVPVNIQASRFLRPVSHPLHILEPLRLKRICNEIEYAAKHHELYHLWWHPHNFGANTEENMLFLERILRTYDKCRRQYGMRSYTMDGFTEEIINYKRK